MYCISVWAPAVKDRHLPIELHLFCCLMTFTSLAILNWCFSEVHRSSRMQAYCDLQRELLERCLINLPNQASSGDDLSKMSWSQVEKKVNGYVYHLA